MVKIKGKSKTDFKSFEDFKKKIRNYILYGIPSNDKKGHHEDIHFRVTPYTLDLVGEVIAAMPPGWFRNPRTGKRMNNSAFYRVVLLAGLEVILEIINEDTDGFWESLNDKMLLINRIAKALRLNDLKREVDDLQDNILKSDVPDKHIIYEEIEKLRKSILEQVK